MKRTKSIFKLFIIPLIAVVLLQAAISFGTVFWSGTTDMLDEYSVGILSQTVENRRIILENHMIQDWSAVSEEVAQAGEALEAILDREQITAAEFQADPALQRELLQEMLSPCLYMLRRNAVTGAFLLLTGDAAGERQCPGIYFRDADPNANPGDYSDILMERGSSRFSQELHIPLDSFWTTDFHFAAPGERAEDDFFYRPYQAALAHPGLDWRDLAYWSAPFVLEEHTASDSYRMFTYTAPLVHGDGTVYGVIGVEVSEAYLSKLLPMRELDGEGQSGYVLALREEDGALTPLFSAGTVALRMEEGGAVPTEDTDYPGLRGLVTDAESPLYAYVSPLQLYNTNAPFSGERWVLAGVQSQQKLFGIGERTLLNLGVALLLGLAFGVACLAATVSHLTRPVRRLAECIRGSAGDRLEDYAPSGITEVDGLYRVVRELTERQRQAEYELLEEKERYRIALQSSTDTLFSYDVGQGCLEVYSIDEADRDQVARGRVSRQEMDRFREEQVHPDDRAMLRDTFQQAAGVIDVVFQFRDSPDSEKYHWVELTGKVINDAQGRRAKVVGSLKSIQERRIRELAEADSLRRDPVTGLYKRLTGERLIAAQLDGGAAGCLILADVDEFRALNERYGSAVGDAVLEQLGRLLLDGQSGREGLVAVRAGGDELELWLPGADVREARDFIQRVNRQAAGLYPGTSLSLRLSAGVAGPGGTYPELLEQAARALACARAGAEAVAVYGECPPERLDRSGGPAPIGAIASSGWARHAGMASQVLGFFDKSSDLEGVLAVLLRKLGDHYELSDILITGADQEFRTVHPAYQWHRSPAHTLGPEARYFTEADFRRMVAAVASGGALFPAEEPRQGPEAEFFLLPEGASGYVVPLFDNGRYCGAAAFVKRRGGTWSPAEQGELQEIAKIVEANINREKYDLASRAKSDFLSRMSHEIRTPMNAIIGMTGIALDQRTEPAEVENCLHQIQQSSQYLLHLINDILDMSKIESGKLKLAAEPFDLRDLVSDVSDMVRVQAEKKGLTLETEVRLAESCLVGDAFHLNQVLVNLLSNAVKFTPSGGRVRLSVVQERAEDRELTVRFSVRDTGIGISRENQSRIFNAFEQADSGTVREYGGTGLGLAISSSLVRMMGGGLQLESAPGQGSDFFFTLPMRRGAPEKPGAAGAGAGAEADLTGRRILVVEDNALNMTITQTILSKNGLLVEPAVNGQEAVDQFAAHGPGYYDLILMDIRMPVMDGLTATREIRRLARPDARTVPIVAMSANAFEEDVKKSLESGMNGHLAKPINVAELLRTLREMIFGRGAP